MIKAICLTKNNIKSINISDSNLSKITENIEHLILKKFISYKDVTISRECDYKYNDKTLSFYAWTNGKAGNENKHDLPPPIDRELYFGNIFVIAHNNNTIINLSELEYKQFYNNAFGGFEDLGSEDSWSEEEIVNSDDSIHDFIIDDNEEDDDYVPEETEEEETEEEETEEEETDKSESSNS